jgi:RNA-directed DNA polymerase
MRMKVKLNQIAKKAMQDKRFKFTSLIHHVNVDNLALCYQELKRNKACGIDNVTVEEYGKDLRRNLTALVERLKAKKYRPKPVRRVYIPKAGKSEKRGLGIPSVEDKIVQIMLKKILESIYEADFLDCSYGFRPKRSCHTAINVLDKSVMTKPVNFIVEVDIKKFFDNVSHYWLHKCLEERISDPNLLWLVRRFLKSGIIEEGQYQASNQGTPQGGNLSPLLSNIYLHYVLDLWFEKKFKAKSKGYVELIRYCDDFVVCCESKQDAEDFLNLLKQRFAKFSLELSEDKTQMIRFGRNAWKLSKRNNAKASTFNFLGFTHYCATSRRGKFIMGHKTSKENLRSKLVGINAWLKKIRSMLLLKDWWPILKAKLTGHYNYFGISGNYRSIKKFYEHVLEQS